MKREKLIADRGPTPCRLIVPIKFHDGRWFPEEARRVQQLDLSCIHGDNPGVLDEPARRRARPEDKKLRAPSSSRDFRGSTV